MKPIPSVIEKAFDIERSLSISAVALAGVRDAEKTAERHEHLGAAARETAKLRRMELRKELLTARAAFPERGPNAKPWGEYLKRLGIDQSTAWRYMHPEHAGPKISCSPHENSPSDDRDVKLANVLGASGEVKRGSYRTPREWAKAVGLWDLDPFSNPLSAIGSVTRCMLEDGGDGFGGGEPGATPGLYLTGDSHGLTPRSGVADATTRVWLQPPYERGFIARVVAHYSHTRFCALLRFAPDTKWFKALWPLVSIVAFPGERIAFETPTGVVLEGAEDEDEDRGAPFPHALYYADERDVTPEVRARCLVWRVDHALDCAETAPEPALHIVK